MNTEELIQKATSGFATLQVSESFRTQALANLRFWLTDEQFKDYQPQLNHIIEKGSWDYLLDCFYQVIPFGTGGRRGEVGIGPNRINPWTIKASAQGHSQYLLKQYGDSAKNRGVVLAYDVRQFFSNQFFDDTLFNPVKDLTSRGLAESAAEVYAANEITVHFFEDVRTTPELSFAIPFLKAVGGDNFSASHNPPEHNGKKVFDEFGGQLIPPFDEALVDEVTQNVKEIKAIPFVEAQEKRLIVMIGDEVDKAYIEAVCSISYSKVRDLKIAYSPMHGCGTTSVLKALQKLGFNVEEDPKTSNPSGKFENITFNIPNPEVVQSFDTPLKFAKEINADIVVSSDPDADRIGVMAKSGEDWVFFNGNEIAVMIANYIIEKRKETGKSGGVVVKTTVTSDLVKIICEQNGIQIIGDLLVGYKYISEEMRKMSEKGNLDDFLFGVEESHGYNGFYVRDKDAASAAVWLCEIAAEQKKLGRTMVDYLKEIFSKYGYFMNYLTEIRMPGAEGKAMIDKISETLRQSPPKQIGRFIVEKVVDHWNDLPIVSETDRSSKNVLSFYLQPMEGTISIKITVRPSGTEPKTKMYYEIGSSPFEIEKMEEIKNNIEKMREELEKEFMKTSYKIIGIDYPDRAFLLFWQMPLQTKLKYFEIEPQIVALKDEPDSNIRKQKLDELLSIFGSDPIEKVDKAFQAEYKMTIAKYLGL